MSTYTMDLVDPFSHTNRIGSILLLGALSIGLMLASNVALAQQSETTVTCDEANDPLAIGYGDSTIGCSIGPAAGESDRFFFAGEAGETVRLRLLTLSNDLDPFVDIRDDMNMPVGTFSCVANVISRCSTGLTFVLPRTGTFLFIVSDSGANNTGNYLLQLEQILPPPDAVTVSYDAPVSDSITPATDTDFFAFEATADTSIRLNLLSLSNDFDPRFQLYDPAGTLVLNGTADGAGCNANSISRCSFAVAYTPTLSGTYSLQVFDDDAFNVGSYRISLWCQFGDCDDAPVPDANGPKLLYVPTTDDSIEIATDGDFFTFNATVDTTVILRGITLSNDLDPRLQVRDPNGDLIANGTADGAGCNANAISRCGFGFTFEPALSGTYSVLIHDDDLFNAGAYRISLFCVLGDCDGDGDGFRDGDREVLSYDTSITANTVLPSTEADFYEFMGSSGDEIRISVTGQSNDFDPRIQVRGPDGALIVNGIGDGGGCDANSISTCTFSKTLFPAATGVYSLALFDNDGFNAGDYDITLVCVFGTGVGFTCEDLPLPPVLCADNCSSIDNLDQRDTDADGFGNNCDADLDNDGDTNVVDLGLFRSVFFTADDDADFNGDGVVNIVDLGILRSLFFGPGGPSCAYPNLP